MRECQLISFILDPRDTVSISKTDRTYTSYLFIQLHTNSLLYILPSFSIDTHILNMSVPNHQSNYGSLHDSVVPVARNMDRNIPPPGTADWNNGLCDCFSHKDCGLMCCCQFSFCSICLWSSTVSQSGLTVFSVETPNSLCWATMGISMFTGYCFGPCIWNSSVRQELAKQNGIDESQCNSVALACCCHLCSMMQMTNEIMIRKNLTFGCASAEPDTKHQQQNGYSAQVVYGTEVTVSK